MKNKILDKNELIELKRILLNLKQSTEDFTIKPFKSPDCIVQLSRALCELKNMQIMLKEKQQER